MAKTTKEKTVKKPAAAKPAKKEVKASAKPVAVAAPAPAPAKPVAKAKSAPKTISAQERYHMIDEAAYYRAEKNGFQVDPQENWIAAEREINELMAKQNIVVG